jgi:hypothetical protein
MTAPDLATWHARERLWSASVAIYGVDNVAWGLGAATTRPAAFSLALERARAIITVGEISPRGAFVSWLAHAVVRGFLSRTAARLLAVDTDLLPMFVTLDLACTRTRPELGVLRVEAAELRARLRAVQRFLLARAMP